MIYLDTSVLLAQLFAEDRKPPASMWANALVSSRLTEYETWVRINALHRAETHGESARRLLSRVSFLEMSPLVLSRALEPFPGPVRTLDALHLASIEFMRSRRLDVTLASYDDRMRTVAGHLAIDIDPL